MTNLFCGYFQYCGMKCIQYIYMHASKFCFSLDVLIFQLHCKIIDTKRWSFIIYGFESPTIHNMSLIFSISSLKHIEFHSRIYKWKQKKRPAILLCVVLFMFDYRSKPYQVYTFIDWGINQPSLHPI